MVAEAAREETCDVLTSHGLRLAVDAGTLLDVSHAAAPSLAQPLKDTGEVRVGRPGRVLLLDAAP